MEKLPSIKIFMGLKNVFCKFYAIKMSHGIIRKMLDKLSTFL